MTNELNRRRAKPTSAKVEIVRNPTSRAAFMAKHQNDNAQDVTTVASDGVTGAVLHTRPGTVVMYKPTDRSGYQARRVSAASMPMLFDLGWSNICPLCEGEHLDRNGNATTDPNACKALPAVALRRCQVCGKRIYDNAQSPLVVEEGEDDDPNLIKDEAYLTADPAQRTKQKLDLHLWVRHPEYAQANGVPSLPEAFREMVETPTQRGT